MSELYELPDGWAWENIDNIIVKTKNKSPQNELEKNFTYIDISSINNKTYRIDEPKILKGSEAPSRAKKEVFKNDIVFATTRPNLKNIAVVNKEYDNAIASTGFCILRSNSKNEFKYLFFYLLSNTFYKELEKDIRGAQYPAVSDTDVKKIKIPLPPLTEQQRIVSKLDLLFEKIDRSIALHQKNMDEANLFMGSVLNDVFRELEEKYGLKTTEEVTTKITDGTHQTPKYIDSGIPFLSVKNISKGIISFEDTRFISKEEHVTLSKRCNVERNDILYTKVGTTGIAKTVDTDKEFSIFVSIALLKPKKDLIVSIFFQYILNSPNCYEQSQSRTRGVANRNLVLNDIKQINFPLPPLPIQQKVVKYLDEISEKVEKIKSVQKEKMDSLVALKASILDKAFRGEL